jgi:hypothetical protein
LVRERRGQTLTGERERGEIISMMELQGRYVVSIQSHQAKSSAELDFPEGVR